MALYSSMRYVSVCDVTTVGRGATMRAVQIGFKRSCVNKGRFCAFRELQHTLYASSRHPFSLALSAQVRRHSPRRSTSSTSRSTVRPRRRATAGSLVAADTGRHTGHTLSREERVGKSSDHAQKL